MWKNLLSTTQPESNSVPEKRILSEPTLPALAHVKSAVLYGSERIKREGLFDTVSQNLADHGIEHIELGGIVGNPVISKVREGGTGETP